MVLEPRFREGSNVRPRPTRRRLRAGVLIAACLIAAAGLVSSCLTPKTEFTCDGDQACVSQGRTGVCETVGFCSYSDLTCPLGRRYGAASGALSGECVG